MAKKLTNPTPVQLPSGSWRCQVMVNGKRISVVDDDPAVAHAKALALKAGLIQKEKPVTSMTVGDAVDRYIESKDSVLSPSTVAGYKRVRKNNMEDIADTRLPLLTQEAVQRWVNGLSKKKSPKSVRNAHGLLSAALAVYLPDMALRTTMKPLSRPARTWPPLWRPPGAPGTSCPSCWPSGWASACRRSWG